MTERDGGGASPETRGRPAHAGAPTPESHASGVRHLYVHTPFCRSRCAYCDFASEPVGPHVRAGTLDAYFGRLRADVEDGRRLLASPLETVYIGGGTPTALPRTLLLGLLRTVRPTVGPGTECTVEADPETLDESLLADLAEAGVTRLSLGVQSFSQAGLTALGRRGSPGAASRAIGLLAGAGWRDWNLDIVFGIPGMDRAAVLADVTAAAGAGAAHVSVYDLTYTDAYARRLERRWGIGARAAAEAVAEEAYGQAAEILQAAGYVRYEVSNYCLPGHESRHNQAYWRGADYLGLGASAVSTVGLRRWTQSPDVGAYLAGTAPDVEELTPLVKRYERVMLGLRTAAGVPWDEAEPVVDPDAVERLCGLGLLEKRCATLQPSPRGLDLGNAVLAAVLRSPE